MVDRRKRYQDTSKQIPNTVTEPEFQCWITSIVQNFDDDCKSISYNAEDSFTRLKRF